VINQLVTSKSVILKKTIKNLSSNMYKLTCPSNISVQNCKKKIYKVKLNSLYIHDAIINVFIIILKCILKSCNINVFIITLIVYKSLPQGRRPLFDCKLWGKGSVSVAPGQIAWDVQFADALG
jgi:hypothetical protein